MGGCASDVLFARTLLWLLMILAMTAVTRSSKPVPPRILDMLAKVDNFKEFVHIFKMEEQLQNFTDKLSPISNVGRGEDGSNVVSLENEACAPRPVAVEIKQASRSNTFRYPFFVRLHRCSGSCGANPFVAKCIASVIEPLKLRVAEITWGYSTTNKVDLGKKLALISMHNETRCSCACANKIGSCNRFQFWRQDNCRCECRGACPQNYDYHPHECCKCARKKPCPHRQHWNSDKCKCECRKQGCRNKRKSRDPRTCRCVCRPTFCRYGTVLNERNCLCKERL